MAAINEKSVLTVEVDFNGTGEDARADMLNRLARLFDQPGTKLRMVFEYGDPEDLFMARDEIDETMRHRNPDIKVKYSWVGKDTGTTEASVVTPMERAGVAIERRRA